MKAIIGNGGPHDIKTFTGKMINVFDPKPEDIDIIDIAHALSFIPRWSGHTTSFYSVAEHCIWMVNHLPEELKLEGLLHDGTEAYICDLPSPIKRMIPQYQVIEGHLDQVIREKYKLPKQMSPGVKVVDRLALEEEWSNLRNKYFTPRPFQEVQNEFLDIFYRYNKVNK